LFSLGHDRNERKHLLKFVIFQERVVMHFTLLIVLSR
jgi:hypothetical protein